jgi:hypothetical protein
MLLSHIYIIHFYHIDSPVDKETQRKIKVGKESRRSKALPLSWGPCIQLSL